MSRIKWDVSGKRFFETGVDQAVLYPIDNEGKYSRGVPWNGITSISESPSGAEATALYADNIKYLNLIAAEDFGATIEAYTYPDEWAACDGSAEPVTGIMIGQQSRKTFGLCYRTKLGNDVQGQDYAYKIHLIYGALAAPSERSYQTVNESPEAITFSWTITTTPVEVTGYKKTACLTIDTSKITDETKLNAILDLLYGTDPAEDAEETDQGTVPQLPMPDKIIEILTGEEEDDEEEDPLNPSGD